MTPAAYSVKLIAGGIASLPRETWN
ncbi:MAG: hypothetical protein RLZZ627_1830, partial [Pseudomonadota bacterium]